MLRVCTVTLHYTTYSVCAMYWIIDRRILSLSLFRRQESSYTHCTRAVYYICYIANVIGGKKKCYFRLSLYVNIIFTALKGKRTRAKRLYYLRTNSYSVKSSSVIDIFDMGSALHIRRGITQCDVSM